MVVSIFFLSNFQVNHLFSQFTFLYYPFHIVFFSASIFNNWKNQVDQIWFSTFSTAANNFGNMKFVFSFNIGIFPTSNFMESLCTLDCFHLRNIVSVEWTFC